MMKNLIKATTYWSTVCALFFVNPLLAQEQNVLEPEFDAKGHPYPCYY